MNKYLFLLLLSFSFAFFLTPLVRRTAFWIGAIDRPNERKIHRQPIARLGGVAIAAAFFLTLSIAAIADYFFGSLTYFDPLPWRGLFLGTGIMVILGAWDDVRPLKASTKFLVQLGAAGLAIGFGFQVHAFPLLGHPIYSQFLSISLTLLWILLVTNAFNLIDGLDGLSGGLAFIAGFTLLAISLVRGDVQTALLITVLCGAIGGFLRYNFHPATIFMGDSGSLFLGYILSLIALQSSVKGVTALAILAPLLALGLPLFDTLLAILRRFLRAVHLLEMDNVRYRFLFAGGKGLFEADRDHIHHRLLGLGLSHRNAVLSLYGIGLMLGALGFLSVLRGSSQYGLLLLAIILASVAGLRKLGYRELEVMRRGLALGVFELPLLGRPFFHPFFDLAIAAAAYYGAFVLKADRFDLGPFKEIFLGTVSLVLAAKLVPFHLLGIYRRSWRYSNIADMIGLGKALVTGSLLFALLATVARSFSFPASVMIIDFLLFSFLATIARTSFRLLEYAKFKGEERQQQALIYGAGRGGGLALRECLQNRQLGLKPVGFVDDDPRKLGKSFNGYPVLGTGKKVPYLVEEYRIDTILLSSPEIPPDRVAWLQEVLEAKGVELKRCLIVLEAVEAGVQEGWEEKNGTEAEIIQKVGVAEQVK